MAVHVDEMVSEVSAEAEPATGEAVKRQDFEHIREWHAQTARDRRRTEAEGYDD